VTCSVGETDLLFLARHDSDHELADKFSGNFEVSTFDGGTVVGGIDGLESDLMAALREIACRQGSARGSPQVWIEPLK
jgi:hypothetical protein